MGELDTDIEVSTAAAHILALLDSVQDQLTTIRQTAERLVAQQEAAKNAPHS